MNKLTQTSRHVLLRGTNALLTLRLLNLRHDQMQLGGEAAVSSVKHFDLVSDINMCPCSPMSSQSTRRLQKLRTVSF